MAARLGTVRVSLDPALIRAGRRSKRARDEDRERFGRLFWQNFDLEKLARYDSGQSVARRPADCGHAA
jgi:hypothetical protein